MNGMGQTLEQLSLEICLKPNVGVEGFLASLFQWLVKGEDLKICEELLSLKYLGLQQRENPRFFSLKTWQDSLTTMEGEPSEQSFVDFGNLGMMSNGRCLILNTLEFHKTGRGCSLLDILEAEVDEKYYLSDKMVKRLMEYKDNTLIPLHQDTKEDKQQDRTLLRVNSMHKK